MAPSSSITGDAEESSSPTEAGASRSSTRTALTRPLPDGIESAQAKLVYLYLRIATEAEVAELATVLGLTRLSLYPILDTLVSRGLAEKRGSVYAVVE